MDNAIKRDSFYEDDHNCYYYTNCSTWYSWGRWVFVVVVVIAFFLLFSTCAFITRRRRRRGLQPYYGTGWMPFHPTHPTHPGDTQFQTYPQQYDPNHPQNYELNNPHTQYYAPPAAPAPPYTPSPQTTGTHFPPTSPPPQLFGYQQSPGHGAYSVPQHSTGGTDYYLPPPGPPPTAHVGKH